MQSLVRWFYEEACSSSFLLTEVVLDYITSTIFTNTKGMKQFKCSPDLIDIPSLCWCTYVLFQTVIYTYKSSVVCNIYYSWTVFSMPNMSVFSTGVNSVSHRIQISWKFLSLERSWPSIACFKLGYFGYGNPSHWAAATQRWGTGELTLYILQKWTEKQNVPVIMELSVSLWTPRTFYETVAMCLRSHSWRWTKAKGLFSSESLSYRLLDVTGLLANI